ncbi:MAG: glycoside hydrolase family 28 protein [Breznakibacter sp.]
MKKNILGFAVATALLAMAGCTPKPLKPLPGSSEIVQRITLPTFPSNELVVTDFGARGDSLTDCRQAFNAAIKELGTRGGGRLVVPSGIFTVNGPIHLVSHIDLHLQKGARIRFGSNPADYLPVVKTSWEGTLLYNYSPFIYAYQCENIAVTGEGVIDGEASATWAKWYALQKDDQLLSRQMNHQAVPVEQRIFGEGHFLRPQLIQFFECRNILVEGIKIEDSPFWCIHLLMCKNATLRKLKYDAQNKNNDGIDPEYSQDILIEDIDFNNADDNVAVKAGRDHEGRMLGLTSENIVVRNCRFKGLHALVIGSEMSAGVRNVFVENCTYAGYLKRGVYLKSNPDRGGFIKNIYVKNLQLGTVEDCIYITSFYHNEGKGHATDIGQIYFENVACRRALAGGVVIQGFPEKKVRDIFFRRIAIDTVPNALSMTDAENIVMADVVIGQKAGSPSAVR